MAIEAVAAVATKEAVAAKAVEAAQQQLIQKLTTGTMEQSGVSQSVEQVYTTNNFRVGEISSPEIENKEIFKIALLTCKKSCPVLPHREREKFPVLTRLRAFME